MLAAMPERMPAQRLKAGPRPRVVAIHVPRYPPRAPNAPAGPAAWMQRPSGAVVGVAPATDESFVDAAQMQTMGARPSQRPIAKLIKAASQAHAAAFLPVTVGRTRGSRSDSGSETATESGCASGSAEVCGGSESLAVKGSLHQGQSKIEPSEGSDDSTTAPQEHFKIAKDGFLWVALVTEYYFIGKQSQNRHAFKTGKDAAPRRHGCWPICVISSPRVRARK